MISLRTTSVPVVGQTLKRVWGPPAPSLPHPASAVKSLHLFRAFETGLVRLSGRDGPGIYDKAVHNPGYVPLLCCEDGYQMITRSSSGMNIGPSVIEKAS